MRACILLAYSVFCVSSVHAQTTEKPRAAAPADTGVSWWRYDHGRGWTISEALIARETRAAEVVKSSDAGTMMRDAMREMANAFAKPANRVVAPAGEMNSMEALSVLELRTRRNGAAQVLGTLKRWTPRRFVNPEISGYVENALMQSVMAGSFQPSLGVTPAKDTSRLIPEHGFHQRALVGYHTVYAANCRSDAAVPWKRLNYDGEELETKNGYGAVVRRQTTLEAASLDVREPYAEVLRSIHPADTKIDVNAILKGRIVSIDANLQNDFQRLIRQFGCASDAIRQFEVNLYLLEQGFPSAQSLLGTRSSNSEVQSTKAPRQEIAPVAEPSVDLSGVWQLEGDRLDSASNLKARITREGVEWVGRVVENVSPWRTNIGAVLFRLRYNPAIQGYSGRFIEANHRTSCRGWPQWLEYEVGLGVFDDGQTLNGEESVVVPNVRRCILTRVPGFSTRTLRRIPGT